LKRIVSISLLLIFLYNLTGYYFTFEFNRRQVCKEIKQRIKKCVPEVDLVTFQVLSSDEKNLFWTKKGKEFRYKGEMYDIVRRTKNGDTVSYSCIRDVKESKLFADLDKHVQKHMNDNPQRKKENQEIFKKLIQSVFIQDDPTRDIASFNVIELEFFFKQRKYDSIIIDKLSPPPQVS
jgi:hypothetical protein